MAEFEEEFCENRIFEIHDRRIHVFRDTIIKYKQNELCLIIGECLEERRS